MRNTAHHNDERYFPVYVDVCSPGTICRSAMNNFIICIDFIAALWYNYYIWFCVSSPHKYNVNIIQLMLNIAFGKKLISVR